MGIAFSAADVLLNSATLYKSATVEFFYSRTGYVYDANNSDVNVISYSAYGESYGLIAMTELYYSTTMTVGNVQPIRRSK